VTGRVESAEPAWRADLVLLGVVLIWGVNIPVMKGALSELHPFAFSFLRLTLSVAFLGCMDAWERRRHRHRDAHAPAERTVSWRMILLLGVMGSLVYQVLFLVGMNDTTASNTGLLVATVPLWTAVIASLSGIDRIRSSAWVGLTVAFAGTAVIALEGGDLDLAVDHLRGNAMVLGAMLLWAAFTVLSKPALAMMSPIRLAYLTSLVVMPGHVALALSHLEPVVEGRLSAGAWESIAYSGLLSTGLAYVLWNDSVRKVGPSHTAICNNLVPVVAVLASWVWLGESITLTQIVGGAMILGGLVAMRRTRKYGV